MVKAGLFLGVHAYACSKFTFEPFFGLFSVPFLMPPSRLPYLVRVRPVLDDPVELLLPLVHEAAVVGDEPLAAPPRHHGRRDPVHGAAQAEGGGQG